MVDNTRGMSRLQRDSYAFLPPQLSSRRSAINLQSIVFTTRRIPGKKQVANLTVEWIDDLDVPTERRRSLTPQNRPVPRKTSTECPLEKLRCDGICGRVWPVGDMTAMGVCEHVICQQCMATAPRAKSEFGVPTCPNPKCYAMDSACKCPDHNKRIALIRKLLGMRTPTACSPIIVGPCSTSESASSLSMSMSNRSAASKAFSSASKLPSHAVRVVLVLFRPNHSMKTDFYEMPSDISLGAAFKSCISDRRRLSKLNLQNRCYIGPDNLVEALDRDRWISVNEKNVNKQLSDLENDKQIVVLVIDTIGLEK